MAQKIYDNKVFSDNLEINVTNKCNLSCRGCTHLSPICKNDNFDMMLFNKTLGILSKVYHTSTVRLLGGEPLLFDRLEEVIDIVRKYNIADKITLVSNALLIDKVQESIFDKIDKLEVSIHVDNLKINKIKEITYYKCDLEIMYFEKFRESYSEIGTEDKNLINDIYKTCLVAHVWNCHNFEKGVFYKCPQAHCFKPYFKGLSVDGVQVLDNKNLKEDLEKYLNSEKPLSACRYCLGAVGKLYDQEQINRNNWRFLQHFPTEQLIDYEFLNKLKVRSHSNNGCVVNSFIQKKHIR